jgi:hypothetical protein
VRGEEKAGEEKELRREGEEKKKRFEKRKETSSQRQENRPRDLERSKTGRTDVSERQFESDRQPGRKVAQGVREEERGVRFGDSGHSTSLEAQERSPPSPSGQPPISRQNP